MNLKGFLLPLVQLSLAGILFCCYAFKNVYTNIVSPVPVHQQIPEVGEKEKVVQSVVAFLQWYKNNRHKANSLPFLVENSSGYFKVNKKACNDYLHLLSSSKLVSDNYIGYWHTYFNDKALQLEKSPVKEEVPDGFDFDFILITQEPELVLNQLMKLKYVVLSISNSNALVQVSMPANTAIDYHFEMERVNGKWQVEYISTNNYD